MPQLEDSNPLATRGRFDKPHRLGYLGSAMSVRYDLRPKIAPATAGRMSLAPTNDPRS